MKNESNTATATPCYSIIIPVYNVAPYLRECLNSVLKQTFANWEAICVDDGSNDGSEMILDEYEAHDKRFRVIHQKNSGVSGARNIALGMIRGNWFIFLDGDDVLNCELLTVLNNVANCQNVDLITYGYQKLRGNDVFTVEESLFYGSLTVNISDEVDINYLDRYVWQYAFRSSQYKNIVFPKYIGGEDRVFLVECLRRTQELVLIERNFYGYRQRVSSVMHLPISFRKLYDDLCSLKDACEICSKSTKKMPFITISWAREFLVYRCLEKAKELCNYEKDNIWKAWRTIVKSFPGLCLLTTFERILLFATCCMPSLDLAYNLNSILRCFQRRWRLILKVY